jgi:hypothetical protein
MSFWDYVDPGAPYKKAKEGLDPYYQESKTYLNPYNQRGNEVAPEMMEWMKRLANPQDLENEWSQGYQKSPYAQQLLNENQSQGMDAASQMGLTGSSAALGNIQAGAGNIVNQDKQQYMNDLMQKYMQAVGIGQNVYNTGANAAGALAGNATRMGENVAQLDFNKQAARNNMFSGLFGMGGGGLFGGGGGMGGQGQGQSGGGMNQQQMMQMMMMMGA